MRAFAVSAALVASLCAAAGCRGLIVREEDGRAERAAKTTAQIALTVVTLAAFPKFQVEVEEADARDREAEERREAATRFRRRWLGEIAFARTRPAMSDAFGGEPIWCRDAEAGDLVCLWSSARVLLPPTGFPEPPAGRIEFDPDRRPGLVEHPAVTALCAIPRDGSDRPHDSCDVRFW